MGCGCKKKNQVPPAPQPNNVKIQVVEIQQTPSSDINLTDTQQQQVNAIVEKIDGFKFLD